MDIAKVIEPPTATLDARGLFVILTLAITLIVLHELTVPLIECPNNTAFCSIF